MNDIIIHVCILLLYSCIIFVFVFLVHEFVYCVYVLPLFLCFFSTIDTTANKWPKQSAIGIIFAADKYSEHTNDFRHSRKARIKTINEKNLKNGNKKKKKKYVKRLFIATNFYKQCRMIIYG